MPNAENGNATPATKVQKTEADHSKQVVYSLSKYGRDSCACDDFAAWIILHSVHKARLLRVQEFLKVFEQLRDEIVNDDLLGEQPDFGKEWMAEVRTRLVLSSVCHPPWCRLLPNQL